MFKPARSQTSVRRSQLTVSTFLPTFEPARYSLMFYLLTALVAGLTENTADLR
jgi:hypothetical protein